MIPCIVKVFILKESNIYNLLAWWKSNTCFKNEYFLSKYDGWLVEVKQYMCLMKIIIEVIEYWPRKDITVFKMLDAYLCRTC